MTDFQSLALARITLSSTGPQAERRKRFLDEDLAELAESIETHGVLQPIIVRPIGRSDALNYLPGDPTHELVAGERRYLAAKRAGLDRIPAVVRTLTDEQVLEVQLIENLQRTDLHPMQEAEGYHELMTKHGHPVDELHARVGKSRSYVYGRLKLLALCDKGRAAFYDGKISASIALLIARIPVPKLQDEVLGGVLDDEMTYREAAHWIQQEFMLRLKGAPFPTGDASLIPAAGACNACPKRTGNQPELFGDIQSADVCTDPVCFDRKRRAHGERKLAEAKAKGQKVIAGSAAKKIAPHGTHSHMSAFKRLDDKEWSDPKTRKVRAIVGPDAPITVIQDPKTGEAVEVVERKVVEAALRKAAPARSSAPSDDRQRAAKAKQERQFREALYAELRPKLPSPSRLQIARALWREMGFDDCRAVAKLRGWSNEQMADSKIIDTIDDADLPGFFNDCLFVRELQVSTWSIGKADAMLAAAKACGVDAAAIRRSLATRGARAKKRNKKMAANKKAAKKKTSKKKTSKRRAAS